LPVNLASAREQRTNWNVLEDAEVFRPLEVALYTVEPAADGRSFNATVALV
jgi:hypothetical protein